MPKPGSSRYLTLATNPLLSNFIGKLKKKYILQEIIIMCDVF